MTDEKRVLFADALRGCGAVTVLFAHVFTCFAFPILNIGGSIWGHLFFLDGQLAVNVFFIVSGFSLSIGFFRERCCIKRLNSLRNMAARRYFRLSVPIFFTSIIIYFLVNNGLMFNMAVFKITDNVWINKFYSFDSVTLYQTFIFSFYKAFSHGISSVELASSLNPVLWTITIEAVGSALVFLVLFVFVDFKSRIVAYVVLSGLFYAANSYMLFFVSGMCIAELHSKFSVPPKLSVLCSFVSVLMISTVSYYNSLSLNNKCLYLTLFIVLFSQSNIGTYFSKKKSVLFLGKISYCLYLIHLPIICSIMSYMVVMIPGASSNGFILLTIGIFTCIISLMCAWLLSGLEVNYLKWQKKIISFS